MLSNIRLKNFKSFKNLEDLKIKPITILCGTNSCGKSSILQSLLLLKQTKDSRNPNQSILFNGKYVHLGDVENVVYGNDKEKEITLSYEYEFTTEEFYIGRGKRHRPSIFHLLRYLLTNEIRRLKNAVNKVVFSTTFDASDKSEGYIKTADIRHYKVSIVTTHEDEVYPGASVIIEKRGVEYVLIWDGVHEPHRNNDEFSSGESKGLIVDFENLYPLISIKNLSKKDESFERIPYLVRNFLRAMDDFIINVNEGVTYIGPLREEPSRRYIYENEVLEIGTKGENAAYIYQTEQDNIVNDHYFCGESEKLDFYLEKTSTLNEALSRWLDLMKIKGFSPDFQSEIIRLNMDANSSTGTRVNIADVGFGVSQIFPILLEGLRMQKNGSLLLEQPEIHLHPSLQMQMADYFISLALSSKNVIVETHSDHIVNRIVRRIVEDDKNDLEKMIAVYFVSNSNEGTVVEEVVIDSLSGIVNWPDGFFDQTAEEQEKIIMAGIKKRKKARNKE